MSAREAFPYPHSMAKLTERAVSLTARLFGNGIARMIEHYIPPEHAGRFAAHLAEELLNEVLPSGDARRTAFRETVS